MARGGPRQNSGGKRNGAGRKKGSGTKKTSKTNELAMKAAGEGVLPLQVMLETMRHHYEQKNFDRAAELAKDAAPYCHPRLSALAVGGPDGTEIPLSIVFVNSPERGDG